MKNKFRILLLSAGLYAALSVQARMVPTPADPTFTFEALSGISVDAKTVDIVPTILRAVNPDLVAPAIPEPETYALMMAGLVLVGAVARRRSRH